MIKFYLIILIEFLFSPFLYLWEEIKKRNGLYFGKKNVYRSNHRIIDDEVVYAVHEWSGYADERYKTIKYVNHSFKCGLKFHFERLNLYRGTKKLRKILTVSDSNQVYIDALNNKSYLDASVEVYPVPNSAMDFSGYSYVAKSLLDYDKEQIIFLTNTSVDSQCVEFIDQYVKIFQQDRELGLLGVSYCSKVYQTLIRNNFRPHLQSFFLVTRTSVLKELIEANGGYLPGENETFKLSIIRYGEVKLTELVQKIGYKAAVLLEDGVVYEIPKQSWYFNGYLSWKLPLNDYRLIAKHPNRIQSVDQSKILT